MKRILFITAFPPNDKTAGQFYTLSLINDLIVQGNTVGIIYFKFPNQKVDNTLQKYVVASYDSGAMNCLFHPLTFPLFSKRFNIFIAKQIQAITNNYDILYFDFSQTFLYAKYIQHRCKVFMCHDVITQKYSRVNKFFAFFAKQTEKRLLVYSNYIFTFSDKDATVVSRLCSRTAIVVNFYLKNKKKVINERCVSLNNSFFIFYGAWNRKENLDGLVWFLDHVMPFLTIRQKIIVIGGGLEQVNLLDGQKNIEYLGFVDDPVVFLENAQALIAPLFSGAGVKVKVIDALSAGTPVIGTNIAFEGIYNVNDSLILAMEAKEYIEILNNWSELSTTQRNKNKNDFISFYSANHFPDYLDLMTSIH